jgi:hypothetical protein
MRRLSVLISPQGSIRPLQPCLDGVNPRAEIAAVTEASTVALLSENPTQNPVSERPGALGALGLEVPDEIPSEAATAARGELVNVLKRLELQPSYGLAVRLG